MRVLVACEYSGVVRDAFIARGHDAMSCDLLPTDKPGPHYQGDVLDIIDDGFDLLIAHPPCTYLAVSGARWWKDRRVEQIAAAQFFMRLFNAPIERVAVENPVGIMSTAFRKPDQYIQPWQFGHGETKNTGLWLRGLPLLLPTNIVDGRESRVHRESPGPDRWKRRSTTQHDADRYRRRNGRSVGSNSMTSEKKERIKITMPLDATGKNATDQKLLKVIDAFAVVGPDSDEITYVNHHGFETPGHIIFDGKRYRTSRVMTYETLTDAAIALVRGN